MDGWNVDGWMVGWMDGWMDGWLDGWMELGWVGWIGPVLLFLPYDMAPSARLVLVGFHSDAQCLGIQRHHGVVRRTMPGHTETSWCSQAIIIL